ncbi:non-hydrolyzing UDP-N-acetylglucosamine 2-epimerase [Ferruginibacter sp. HRS2-29]|uniref:non-hydrolyzing UDP-N-acetylglucosamine 2-epimerase n=1 Tax=Ferruginibacter sp. HRS2-29 TaxID=2487334 RepID=UPI0020CB72EE|nr:UDP-N-acetylglucosamine 2-epimerase (non-hydrolyzing) [Ferruginibacter sp. HRS2-29]MCP9751041.1 UDP-N-acetylglucosamine 2-epimerase (non-hydrolyzing) [Ferruginibacter sp. HRS2-29]
MLITIVAGARPNFMKIAPIIKAINAAKEKGKAVGFRLVHTGQHYDKKMSGDFFEQLGIPDPHTNLECGGGSQAEQTAAIMVKFEKEIIAHKPTVVLVVGDVTSTMACTITAKKLCIDVVHVEAGIRSGDMTMPEEINRIVTDSICDHFFTTTEIANKQLAAQQVPQSAIHFVGNTMIDTLYQNLEKIKQPSFWPELQLAPGNYFLLTLHRPSNVDDGEKLKRILEAVISSTAGVPIVFPVHPRTRQMMDKLQMDTSKLLMIDPQGYHEFIYLVKNAKGIITDSGGITEEATVLHIPCLTMRNSTERPETVTMGTNELVGDDLDKLSKYLQQILAGEWKKGDIPAYWDGKTSERIVEILDSLYNK